MEIIVFVVFIVDFRFSATEIVHMRRRKARIHPVNHNGKKHQFARNNPFLSHPDSEATKTWELLKTGRLTPDKLTLMGGDGSVDATRFYISFGIVSDPMHPKNNWKSAVAKVKIRRKEYLRLVDAISVPAMEYWKAHGYPPPYEWAIFDSKTELPVSSSNPYPPAQRLHDAFNMASDWITPDELLDRISTLPRVNRKYASSILHNLGNVTRKQNNGRSRLEEQIIDGVRMIRAVRIG